MPVLPSVSVILPTFNRAGYLGEAIDSILGQSHLPQDIVVVDDGSTDETGEIVARFGSRVGYVRQPNSGKLTAIATGLDRVRGDLVWIMDDDDIAPPDALRDLATPFADNPAVVMSYGGMTRFSGSGPDVQESRVDYPDDPRPFFVQLMECCFITGHPCVLVRRDALEATRPFDPAIFASVDYYLHLNVAMQGPVAAVGSVVLRQRQHDGLRGPRQNRYGEAERVAKWIAHDAYIMTGLLDRLPLVAYLDDPPWNDRPLTVAERQRAVLQRGVIAGRNKLWPRAVEDLQTALAIHPDVPLDAPAIEVLSGLLGSRYGFDEVLGTPEILDGLRRATTGRADRGAVLTAMSRPMLQRIRSGRRVAPTLAGWFRLMDLSATGLALRTSAVRNMSRAAQRLRGG